MFIERLTLAQRNRAGLRKAEARMLHVVEDTQINLPVKPSRYNIKETDGTIKKITLFDTKLIVDIFKKIAGKYKKIETQIINGSNSSIIK